MTDEIRKLLGGYATNALTVSERAALLEAALNDQELFDALQNEDALRELLADPVTRAEVRQALEPDVSRSAKPFWFAWQWMTGAAALAAVAIVLIVVQWPHAPEQVTAPRQIAANQITQQPAEPKLEAPPAAVVQPRGAPRPKQPQEAQRESASTNLAQFEAPPAAGPAATDATSARLGGAINGAAPPVPAPSPAVAPALAAAKTATQDSIAAEVANAPLYRGPLVRYSILRNADAVRIGVTSQIAGNLALYRADAAGQWQRIFPANNSVFQIVPNMPYQIPNDALAVRDAQDKLRLVIDPAPARAAANAQSESFGKLSDARSKVVEKAVAPAPARFVVEIPLGN